MPGTAPYPNKITGKRFLNGHERRCVEAIIQRIIPSDDIGPGAREAGVGDFIDDQLAGAYGRGERWYMKGPFGDALKTQGYQSEQPPGALYRDAIAALDNHCISAFDGKSFAELSEADQDSVLKQIEDEEIEFKGVSARAFFELLKENTIEGFFCDPIYGGNRGMIGWKMVGFPGAQYDYRDHLNHDGNPIALEPVGLTGRPAWNAD